MTKEIQWLEQNANKTNLFYFKENEKDKEIIDCYFKSNNKLFAIYNKDIINKIMKEGK